MEMEIMRPFENNYPVVRNNADAHIEKAKSRGRSFSYSINEQGLNFNIIFTWEQEKLTQSLIIRPFGVKVYVQKLELILGKTYYSYWRGITNFEFELGSVALSGFKDSNALNAITIDGVSKKINISISDTTTAVKVHGANQIFLNKVSSSEISITNSNSLKITDTYCNQGIFQNCAQLYFKGFSGDYLKISGKTITANLQHSKFEDFRLVETSFDKIECIDFSMANFILEMPNPEGNKGHLIFKDSVFHSELTIDKALFGSPMWSIGRTKKTNASRLHPIYLFINDNKFNPSRVELNEVEWNYNGIVSSDTYPEGKRKFINLLKNYYVGKDDILNTQLQYAFEKKWYLENHRNDFPLWLTRWSNNFGLSLVLPVIGILLICIIESSIILKLSYNCYQTLCENWGVFFHLLNPTHNTNIFTDVLGECPYPKYYSNFLPLIDNIGRILIGYLIFQFANAFRYKYKLR